MELSQEIVNGKYAGLDDSAASDAINSATVTVTRPAPIAEIQRYIDFHSFKSVPIAEAIAILAAGNSVAARMVLRVMESRYPSVAAEDQAVFGGWISTLLNAGAMSSDDATAIMAQFRTSEIPLYQAMGFSRTVDQNDVAAAKLATVAVNMERA